MDETSPLLPHEANSHQVDNSPEPDRRFLSGVFHFMRKRKTKAVAVGVGLATAATAGGVIANNELSSGKPEGAGQAVTYWNGAEVLPAGTQLLEKPDDQAVSQTVPEGNVLLVQRPEVVYTGNESYGKKSYLKFYSSDGREVFIDQSKVGIDKNRQTYAYQGTNPEPTTVKNSQPGVQALEIAQGETVPDHQLQQRLQQDGLDPKPLENNFPS